MALTRPLVSVVLAVLVTGAAQSGSRIDALVGSDATSELRDLVNRYALDRAALLRRYPVEGSPVRQARLCDHYREWQRRLDATPFEPLGLEGRLDHVLRSTWRRTTSSPCPRWRRDLAAADDVARASA